MLRLQKKKIKVVPLSNNGHQADCRGRKGTNDHTSWGVRSLIHKLRVLDSSTPSLVNYIFMAKKNWEKRIADFYFHNRPSLRCFLFH